jgi:hypothetical protein
VQNVMEETPLSIKEFVGGNGLSRQLGCHRRLFASSAG